MEEIWAAVRELESVLLEFLDRDSGESSPSCHQRDLEVLDDVRLALSSAITEDERLDVLVPVPEPPEDVAAPSPLAEAPSSLLEHDENSSVMLTKRINQYNTLFILFLYRKC